MTLCVYTVMSLSKAAEVLNKILCSSNISGEASLIKSVRSLPPVLPPQGTKNFQKEEKKNLKFLQSSQLNRLSEYDSEYDIEQNSSNNSISTDEDSLDCEVSTDKDDANVTVISLGPDCSGHPFIGKIFTLDESPEAFVPLTNVEFDEFTPLDPSKYKTELCRSYHVHGYCKYGIRCNYAHGLTQIRIAYRHGKYKTRNCQSYHEMGFCRYGARCSFIHDAEEGIMKCPITDREVLEALHYRPMSEFRHIATITWRMLENDSYTPTEVHFFTPSVQRDTEEISIDTRFLSDFCEACPSVNGNSSTDENQSLVKENDSENKLSAKTAASNELCKISLFNVNHGPAILENKTPKVSTCLEVSTTDAGKNSQNLRVSFANCKICDELNKKNENIHDEYKTKENAEVCFKENDKKYEDFHRPPTWVEKQSDRSKPLFHKNISSVDYPNYSATFKKFNLEDFLNCLRTREGNQHLSLWSSEMERNSRVSENFSNSTAVSFSTKRQAVRNGRDLSKYKTELCRSYQYNKYCEYKEACLYAHGTEDLRSYPKHPLYRTKKCFSFHKKGFCLYGSRCQFLHDAEIPLLH